MPKLASLSHLTIAAFLLGGCMNAALSQDGEEKTAEPNWSLTSVSAPSKLPFEAAPAAGLPDGGIARLSNSSLKSAWYEQPTRRYGHAILGDDIEAGTLVVETATGTRLEAILPDNEVFEDRTPRLVDLNGDGTAEIITIIAEASSGAALAVYGEKDGRLERLSQTSFIGLRNRWRNIAGIADFDGDGHIQIAEVVTPHIGGTLRFWTWKDEALLPSGNAFGFSNHAIGSRHQGLSAVEDFNGDGVEDIALPDARRKSLRIMAFSGTAEGEKSLQEIATIPLPASVEENMRVDVKGQTPSILVGLSDGTWLKASVSKPVQ